MAVTREVAQELVTDGLLEITQKGEVVDPNNFKGPIRLRLRLGPGADARADL